MNLYLKYRPKIFADVVGQDHIVTTLEQASKSDKLSHAYLFAGTRGTGKTSVARILAREIMTKGISDEAITAQVKTGIEEGNMVDLIEIDGASNRGIDDVRELIEKIQFTPVAAKAKVYIIDEVHMLTKEAFNALLKTLEEPPVYAFFILATTELHKVPATIQSRCQGFPFRKIKDDDIIRRLQFIADQERINVDREAVRAIASHCEGGLRDAISLLDQLRSLEKITVDDVQQRIGASGAEHIEAILQAVAAKDPQTIIKHIRSVEEAGIALDVFLRQIVVVIREAIHQEIENKKPIDGLLNTLDVLLSALRDVRIAPVPGLVVESALLSLCQETDSKAVVKTEVPAQKELKAEAAKKETAKEVIKEAAKETAEKPAEITEKENTEEVKTDATIEVPELTLENIQEQWQAAVKVVQPAPVKMSLKNGQPQSLEGKTLTVAFASSFHRDIVAQTDASRAAEKVLKDIFKQDVVLKCVLDVAGSSEPDSEPELVNLAQAAKEVFS